MGSDNKLINVQNVNKVYKTPVGDVVALTDCNFSIEKGDFMGMVGPSGCGKTTILNLIAGFDTVTEGKIYMEDKLIAATSKRLQPGPDRLVVFQNGALFPWMTNMENICFGPLVQGLMTKEEAKEKALELSEIAGLNEVLDQYPSFISSGLQRRVEIVRSLICDPKLLLLDEPFRALDAVSKALMHEYLLSLYDRTHKTIMFITHDIDEAVYLASRVFVMTTRPGRLKKLINIDLPRPRKIKDTASTEFLHYRQEIFELVGEEARKAFERGERELA
ncbi:MAG: ABC transporter ATP-binding protein [Pseudomonadota bacterium]